MSQVENGQIKASLERLDTLATIYDVPLSELAERYQLQQKLIGVKVSVQGEWSDLVQKEYEELMRSGDFSRALAHCSAWRERLELLETDAAITERIHAFRLYEIDCLIHLSYFRSARQEVDQVLNGSALMSPVHRFKAWRSFAITCYRLKSYAVAELAIEKVERLLDGNNLPLSMRAEFFNMKGNNLGSLSRHQEAIKAYHQAIKLHQETGNDFEVCCSRINLANSLIEQGRSKEAEEVLQTALETAENGGFQRLIALARSHECLIAYRSGNLRLAKAHSLASNTIARNHDLPDVYFRNTYYLREIARTRNDHAAARSYERTLRTYLNRVDDNLPEARQYCSELAQKDCGGGDA